MDLDDGKQCLDIDKRIFAHSGDSDVLTITPDGFLHLRTSDELVKISVIDKKFVTVNKINFPGYTCSEIYHYLPDGFLLVHCLSDDKSESHLFLVNHHKTSITHLGVEMPRLFQTHLLVNNSEYRFICSLVKEE